MKSTKFKNIFEGLKIAYGQYQKGERNGNGNQHSYKSVKNGIQ